MAENFRKKVFHAVSMIPEGKVGTYAQVAQLAGFAGAARAVGNTLHLNTDPVLVPCHRIVRSDGSLACGYAFGGPEKQKERLIAEGVVFTEGTSKVDLARYGISIEEYTLMANATLIAGLPYEADYSGINVPLVAVCNVPPVAQCNVPPQKWLQ